MMTPRFGVWGVVIVLVFVLGGGCERQGPAEKAGEKVDEAAVQTGNMNNEEGVERVQEAGESALKKAKGVERSLGEAAKNTAEQVKEAIP